MENTSKKITEAIIDGLRTAATELEEFQLQFALGKADASDKYEELKKELNLSVHELNLKINKGIEQVEGLKGKFEELQIQLELGKADTKEAFENQKEKISKAIQELEYSLKHNKVANEYIPILKQELEKFKIKMDILYTKYDIDSKKKEFLKTIDDLKNKYIKKEEKSTWDHFSDEIEDAFSHFKKAFKK